MSTTTQADRDYPEDQGHPACSDGHTCLKCGGLYSGVRGRWVCRVCDTPVSVRTELLRLRSELSALNPQLSTP